MKEELGLDHFEGRSWRGFHHHACLVMLAYGFLALEQQRAQRDPARPGKKGVAEPVITLPAIRRALAAAAGPGQPARLRLLPAALLPPQVLTE